ncbi:hypothetical protein GCM10010415_29720 [Streptomyces atrovirens]|uniref:Universal stress protein n=1 Tax=Streptomyces atrovirens TaxID=285556 RepID=A0ABW0DXA7_9ACTN
MHVWHVPLSRGVVDAEERARIRQAAEREFPAFVEPWHQKYPSVFVREELREGLTAHVPVRAWRGMGLLVAGRRTRRAAAGPVVHALTHRASRPVVVVSHD